MLSPKEQFKVGFLLRCAEKGLSIEESLQKVATLRELVKTAGYVGDLIGTVTAVPKAVVSGVADTAVSVLKKAPAAVLATALLGPPVVGAGLGALGAKLTNLNDEEPDETKTQELVDEYRRSAEEANMRAAIRQQNTTKRRTRPLY